MPGLPVPPRHDMALLRGRNGLDREAVVCTEVSQGHVEPVALPHGDEVGQLRLPVLVRLPNTRVENQFEQPRVVYGYVAR